MRPRLHAPSLPVLLLLAVGSAAAEGDRPAGTSPCCGAPQVAEIVVTKTAGWQQIYGRPVYRCRRFSSECYYERRVHYVRHRSASTATRYVVRPARTVEGAATQAVGPASRAARHVRHAPGAHGAVRASHITGHGRAPGTVERFGLARR